MFRTILIILVLLLTVVGGLMVVLFKKLGWMAFLVIPLIVIALGWLTKTVVSRLIKRVLLKAFAMKSDVLLAADLTIHSVERIPKPPVVIDISDPDSETGGVPDDDENDDGDDGPKEYFETEMTIAPAGKNIEQVWEPAEMVLLVRPVKSLLELEESDTVGIVHEVKIWDGDRLVDDDPGKYSGEQKLRVTFEVDQGTRKAILHYYNHALGEIEFPSPQLSGETIVDV